MNRAVRPPPELYGEICDVDERTGGFNVQWAWASGVFPPPKPSRP